MLIETRDIKNPPRESLGSRKDPLVSSSDKQNGHVARSMQLALLAMDVVEPYVVIKGVEGMQFEDEDVVNLMNLWRYDWTLYFENGMFCVIIT